MEEHSAGLEALHQVAPRSYNGAMRRTRTMTLDTNDLQGLLANSSAKLHQLFVSAAVLSWCA